MNEMNNTRVTTLKDLWRLFIRRIIVIALAAAVAVGSVLFLDTAFYKPQYSSTATIYIMGQSGDGHTSSGEAANDLNLALRLVYDCNYFLKSRTVLDTVIEDLDLDMTYNQLRSRISTTNPNNTRILEITVEGDSPEQAKAIVDMICTVGPAEIEDTMGFGQVGLYEYGNLPQSPSNRPSILKYIAVGVAAAAVTYAVFLLMYVMDDRIRSDEDIETLLGLSILAEIPNASAGSGIRYGYKAKRSYTPSDQRGKNKKKAHGAEKRS